MSGRKPHILCFAPYTDWSIHSAREVTIVQALRARGCTATYVACDGAFTDCDVRQVSKGGPGQRIANVCLVCQANVATRLAGWGMPYAWLGRWARPEDKRTAGDWVARLNPADYATATYRDWQIGAWVRSSVHTHMRAAVLDLTDAATRTIFGSYLYSGLLAALALERLFDDQEPNVLLMINGRMGPTRIALEFARQRGIRVLVEERSALPGRMILYDNEYCLGLDGIRRLSKRWRDQALTHQQVGEIAAVLESRWLGRATDVSVFSRGLGHDQIHAHLGLDSNRPLWVLFTSSMDETADVPHIGSSFKDQEHWITSVIAAVGAKPNLQLVIRVHPNVGSAKSLGRSTGDIAFFEALATRLPANVRLIQSSADVSSYALAAAADAGLVWYSTIGLEMAAMGKPVVRAAAHWMGFCDFIPQLHAQDSVVDAVTAHISRAAKDGGRALAVSAWRFAHLWFLRQSIPFPLVLQPKWYAGELAWSSIDELAPGRDPELDRICEITISGRPLHDDGPPPPPSAPDAEADTVWQRLAQAMGIAAKLG